MASIPSVVIVTLDGQEICVKPTWMSAKQGHVRMEAFVRGSTMVTNANVSKALKASIVNITFLSVTPIPASMVTALTG